MTSYTRRRTAQKSSSKMEKGSFSFSPNRSTNYWNGLKQSISKAFQSFQTCSTSFSRLLVRPLSSSANLISSLISSVFVPLFDLFSFEAPLSPSSLSKRRRLPTCFANDSCFSSRAAYIGIFNVKLEFVLWLVNSNAANQRLRTLGLTLMCGLMASDRSLSPAFGESSFILKSSGNETLLRIHIFLITCFKLQVRIQNCL